MVTLRRNSCLCAAVWPAVAGLCCAWTLEAEAQSAAGVDWSTTVPLAAVPSDAAAEYLDQGQGYVDPITNELGFDPERYLRQSPPAPLDRADLETANLDAPAASGPKRSWVWTIDYRLRSVSNSHTSYEFGTPELPPAGWTPLSRLDFPLNSFWHGLEVGIEGPSWEVRFEWLTPVERNIQGDLEDYDWMVPGAEFTDLGLARQRWIDAQMLDLGLEFRLWDRLFGLPIEVWPVGGFQWQRFGIMCYDLVQVKEDNVWWRRPYSYQGDVLSLKQDYYFGYVGGQLRTTLDFGALPPIQLTLQGDWGLANGYNVDHHLIREGDRYTMETTSGDSWHVALTAEALLRQHLSLGFEVDYLQIRTTGKHRWLNEPEDVDQTWDHGVRVWSDQMWLTAFIGFRI